MPPVKPVRYAVVGLGHIAQVAVLRAFAHARRNSTLVAVYKARAATEIWSWRYLIFFSDVSRPARLVSIVLTTPFASRVKWKVAPLAGMEYLRPAIG